MPSARPARYEVHPTSPRWGVFEHGEDEPAVAGIGSREAADDLADAMNMAARRRAALERPIQQE